MSNMSKLASGTASKERKTFLKSYLPEATQIPVLGRDSTIRNVVVVVAIMVVTIVTTNRVNRSVL